MLAEPFSHYRVEPSGCWTWLGGKTTGGYGVMRRAAGQGQVYAHRAFYEREHGPIPDGLQIDHTCSNRPCVNPAHLEAVTPGENTRRGTGIRLSPADVAEIALSPESSRTAGRRFGVSHTTILKIRRGHHHLVGQC